MESDAAYNHITLLAYRSLGTSSELLTSINQSTNTGLLLAGVYLTKNGVAQELRTDTPIQLSVNDQIEISLVWQALTETSENYAIFVHLLGEDGRLIAQHDSWASFGSRPTFTWENGEQVLDKHRLMIHEGMVPSNASLVVGLYHSETGERQIFDNGQDHVWLADMVLSDSK